MSCKGGYFVRKHQTLWTSLTAQVVSAVAVVGIVVGGVWLTEHPKYLGQLGLAGHAASTLATGGVTASPSSGSTSNAAVASVAGGVTDKYLQKLQVILDGISGLQEVALGPSANGGSGEELTATVSVPVGSNVKDIEESLIKQYMADVFATDPLVQTANVYFVSDGQFLAGGGLSRGAYSEWAVSTTAGQEGDVEAWMSSLQAGSKGNVSGWFETASPASAGN